MARWTYDDYQAADRVAVLIRLPSADVAAMDAAVTAGGHRSRAAWVKHTLAELGKNHGRKAKAAGRVAKSTG